MMPSVTVKTAPINTPKFFQDDIFLFTSFVSKKKYLEIVLLVNVLINMFAFKCIDFVLFQTVLEHWVFFLNCFFTGYTGLVSCFIYR